jgi:hypothetical protein
MGKAPKVVLEYIHRNKQTNECFDKVKINFADSVQINKVAL